jgi:hypothetical protein
MLTDIRTIFLYNVHTILILRFSFYLVLVLHTPPTVTPDFDSARANQILIYKTLTHRIEIFAQSSRTQPKYTTNLKEPPQLTKISCYMNQHHLPRHLFVLEHTSKNQKNTKVYTEKSPIHPIFSSILKSLAILAILCETFRPRHLFLYKINIKFQRLTVGRADPILLDFNKTTPI